MTFLLDVAIRCSIPVAAGLLGCLLLRRRSAALRHHVLAAALAAAAAVVPLSFVVPSWSVPLPAARRPVEAAPAPSPDTIAVAVVSSAQAPAARAFDLSRIVFVAWVAGVVVGTGLLLLGVVRLVRLTMRASPVVNGPWPRLAAEIAARYGVRRRVVLLATRTSDVLATWGLIRPRVLVPRQAHTWSEDRARVALCHELAHVRRCDWPVQIAADLLRTVFWFNPLFWVLCARLRRESEHACDDAVLATGVPAASYASHLVDIAKACRVPARAPVPAMSIARPSTLEGRITAMLNTSVNRQAPTTRTMALVVVSVLAMAVAIASFDAFAQSFGPGALTGHVYDASGGVLPGVEVTLTGGQQARRSAVSDGSGRFAFASVGPGAYSLEVELPGFRPLRNEFTLAAPADWTRNITLQVGQLEETIRVTAKRPAQAVPPASIAASGPVRVGGNIKQPRKVKDVHPIYPAAMQDAALEGLVPMEALIGTDGSVVSVRVLSAEVHPEFARAAETAVRQWRFTPTMLNNRAVEVQVTVSVDFTLED